MSRMAFFFAGVFGVAFLAVPMAALTQSATTQQQAGERNPDFCGAAGAGCDPEDVQKWKAIGNKLADLSSADLSQYAYACAENPGWKTDCETDPVRILRRLGIEGY